MGGGRRGVGGPRCQMSFEPCCPVEALKDILDAAMPRKG